MRAPLTRRGLVASLAVLAGALAFDPGTAEAASASQITQDSLTALQRLYADEPHTRTLGSNAKAIL
ncbi:MAG TPA: hypothetical protein VMA86_11055, partial [Acetobacteraceae bacterium]|nr:hypothetical protein [Acetobacteraceae bacterium]